MPLPPEDYAPGLQPVSDPREDADRHRPPSGLVVQQGPADIRALQVFLAQSGYNPGAIDGIYGPRTQTALHAFQQANGLEINDLWTPQLREYIHTVAPSPTESGQAPAPVPDVIPGTGQVAPASTDPTEEERQIRERYPTLAFYLNHSELGPLLRQAYSRNWSPTELIYHMMDTKWWKERSTSAREFEALRMTNPGEATRQVAQQRLNIQLQASRAGISLTAEQIDSMAEQALMWAWTADELNVALANFARNQTDINVGSLGDTVAQVRGLARNYLVTLNDADLKEFAVGILEGSQSLQGVEAFMRNQAKSRFGWMTEEIDSGLSPSQFFAPLRNQVANVLELNPNDIDLMDPRWAELTEFVDKDGRRRSMTYTEASKWARTQNEWRFTRNANESAANVTNALGKVFGRL